MKKFNEFKGTKSECERCGWAQTQHYKYLVGDLGSGKESFRCPAEHKLVITEAKKRFAERWGGK